MQRWTGRDGLTAPGEKAGGQDGLPPGSLTGLTERVGERISRRRRPPLLRRKLLVLGLAVGLVVRLDCDCSCSHKRHVTLRLPHTCLQLHPLCIQDQAGQVFLVRHPVFCLSVRDRDWHRLVVDSSLLQMASSACFECGILWEMLLLDSHSLSPKRATSIATSRQQILTPPSSQLFVKKVRSTRW